MSGIKSKLFIFWGVLFLISLLLANAGLDPSFWHERSVPVGSELPTIDPGEVEKPEEATFNWALMMAAITAAVSLGGFVATTHFAFREDRRQVDLHQLQIESLKREIEHKDLEIAKLRRQRDVKALSHLH